jgi:hypothetical protein
VVFAVLAVLVFLGMIAATNPRTDIPLISPLVCSLKGDTWYGGGLLGPPGCYRFGNG